MIRSTIAAAVIALALSLSVSAQDSASTSMRGYFSMTDTCTLPPPLISDADVATYKTSYDSIQKAILVRKATAPDANCALPALRTIICNNEPLVHEIAYGKVPALEVVKQMYLAEIASAYQKSAHEATTAEFANVQ